MNSKEIVIETIEYHFLVPDKKLPYQDLKISSEKCEKLFSQLRNKFGETEIIKDYTIYKHQNLELTVLPDGSSFCYQTLCKALENKKPYKEKNIETLIFYQKKTKVSNDTFPPDYFYDDVIDYIDVIFKWNDKISIIFTIKYMEDFTSHPKSMKQIGRPEKTEKLESLWSELYLSVECDCDVDSVHHCLDYIENILN